MFILIVLLGLIAAAATFIVVVGFILSGPRYKGPITDHFNGSRFENIGGARPKGGRELIRWLLKRKASPWTDSQDEGYGKHPLGVFKGGIRVTFINHATFLIQVDGVNILTDPVWSKRVSPFPWIGPRRKKPPGIRFGDLPRIHLVLLTHNHYDHLDIQTMRMVFGAHHPQIIAPLGIGAYLKKSMIPVAKELDWWDEVRFETIVVTAVPAQHFSGRGMLDREATLWCGFVLKTSAGNVYFAGDTGYNNRIFHEIGSRFQKPKVSILPIGAYKPEWFMSTIHVSPEEAVMIHRDVQSQVSIGMHFGTFALADDNPDDAVRELEAAKEKYSLSRDEFIVLREGEVKIFE